MHGRFLCPFLFPLPMDHLTRECYNVGKHLQEAVWAIY